MYFRDNFTGITIVDHSVTYVAVSSPHMTYWSRL